jgi:TonB family protein
MVVLHATIGTDGLAHDIQVVRPLGYGLDELAVEAVKNWTFKPAQSSGKPSSGQDQHRSVLPLSLSRSGTSVRLAENPHSLTKQTLS